MRKYFSGKTFFMNNDFYHTPDLTCGNTQDIYIVVMTSIILSTLRNFTYYAKGTFK